MNIFFKITLLSIVLMAFSNCSSSQKLQRDTSFVIGNCTSQKWVAGVQGGGAGTDITFNVGVLDESRVQLDSLFFRGNKTSISVENTEVGNQCVARFSEKDLVKQDVVMHSDPKKEFGNKPPVNGEEIPFEIKNDEAILMYTERGKTKYYKLEGIKELPTLYYPSAKPKKEH